MTETFVWKDKFHWSKAFSRSDVPSVARAVAYVIHNHAGGDGKNSHPGMDVLMVDTGLSESSVTRHLKTITGAGWVHQVSSGSNSGRRALASVYDLTYPPGYSEAAAKELRDEKLRELRESRRGLKEHPSPVTDDPKEHPSQMTGDNPSESGTPVTHDGEHLSPVTGTPVTSDCLPDPLPDPLSDPHPLSREEDECDVSSLYDREVNEDAGDAETLRYVRLTELLEKGFTRSVRTDAEHQELLDAGFTYVDGPRFSINGGPTGGWRDPSPEAFARRRELVDVHRARLEEAAEQRLAVRRRQWDEMQRVEAEARAERDRQFEAKRAQRQAQAEIDNLAELKSIEWVSRNWDRFEKYCSTEGVNLDRQLSLARRAQEKATSSPFGLFKSMVANGVEAGSSNGGRDTSCASPASGHAWQE